jgi:hypothetical protein
MSTTNDFNDIVKILQELNTINGFEVYIPSLEKNIKFKQLNTEQLKKLLKTVIDSPIYNTQLILTFNEIIKENCLEQINVDKLTILDKHIFLLKTRIESISSDYTFTFSEKDIAEYNLSSENYTINLNSIYDNFINNLPDVKSQTYNYETFTITCSLPTLEIENKLEQELHQYVKLKISTPDELRSALGDTFINEITKYISELKINEQNIDLNTYDFKSRIQIIEQLPTNTLSNVLKYIENYKTIISSLFNCSIITENGIEFTKELPQDATFFNIS